MTLGFWALLARADISFVMPMFMSGIGPEALVAGRTS
jgi:hypothetical protein